MSIINLIYFQDYEGLYLDGIKIYENSLITAATLLYMLKKHNVGNFDYSIGYAVGVEKPPKTLEGLNWE